MNCETKITQPCEEINWNTEYLETDIYVDYQRENSDDFFQYKLNYIRFVAPPYILI